MSGSITSRSTGGSNASHRSSSRRHGRAATCRVIAGSSTRRTSRSTAGGRTCTGPVDQYGQVIDVWLSARRDLTAARMFFTRAPALGVPVEVTTDREPAYPRVLDELVPTALHDTEQYANNRVEADHGRLKARLRPRCQDLPISTDPCHRPRLRAEPQTRPLRHRHRRTGPSPATGGVR